MPEIALVAAIAANRAIGLNNTLPWRCPADLRYFKELTLGHHLIMGRKTFESIGRPLPGRTTVVVTRNEQWQSEGCLVAGGLPEAIDLCDKDDKVFIVGGADIYTQALQFADSLYLTEIGASVEGDAFFPAFDRNEWQETARTSHAQSEPQPLEFDFVVYRRKARPC